MSIITKMLKQTCVYWALASGVEVSYDDYGQPIVTIADSVELSCRWEDVQEEYIAPDGTKQLSRSKVYVESDVVLGGILMLGTKSDITDAVNIKENVGAWEIMAYGKLPNFRATEFLRTVYL